MILVLPKIASLLAFLFHLSMEIRLIDTFVCNIFFRFSFMDNEVYSYSIRYVLQTNHIMEFYWKIFFCIQDYCYLIHDEA